MPGLSIYLDECVNHAVIPLLSVRGHIVITTQSQGTANDPDDAQIRYATARGWVVLTTNRKHYHQRHHEFQQRGERHGGIITVPQDDDVPDRFFIRCALMAAWVVNTFTTPENTLFRWSDLQTMLHGEAIGWRDSFVRISPLPSASVCRRKLCEPAWRTSAFSTLVSYYAARLGR